MKSRGYRAHESYEMHCRYCADRFDADTSEQAYRLVKEHENGCPHKGRRKNGIVSNESSNTHSTEADAGKE